MKAKRAIQPGSIKPRERHGRIEDLPMDARPYEKCEAYGAESLSDAELLAVILKCGTKDKSSVALAEEILYSEDTGDGLLSLMHYGMRDFMEIKGVGRVKALQLLCIGELSKRISRQRAVRELRADQPESVARYYMEDLRHNNAEGIYLMLLDTRKRLIKSIRVSMGSVNASHTSAREIFAEVLKHRAAFFIMVHNHPSGDPTPSEADVSFTERLFELGQMMNVPLLDALVIGDGTYVSFRADGGLQE